SWTLKGEDSNSSKTNHSGGKSKDAEGSTTSGFETSGTSALRSASGTPSKKQSSLSSSRMQKPERLEKHSPLTTPVKRVEKQSMPSPARRSERGENQQMLQMLSCSGSEKYEESSSSSETENGDQKGPVVVLRKKKWLDARSFRAFLQFKSKKAGQPDFGEKFGRQDNSTDEDSSRYDNLSDGDSGCSGTGGSKDVDGIDECNGKKGGEESLEKSSSGSGKLADGTVWNVDDRKIDSAHVSRNCKICSEEAQVPKHRDSSLPKYSDGLLQSSPDGLKGEGTLDDAARLEMDCSTRADLQETVMDGDRTEAECLVIKDLQTLEPIFSTSSRGRTPSSNFVLERGGTDGTLKGKRNAPDPDSDISVTAAKEICGMETSSADAISSSPSGGTTSQISRSCAACFKRQRVGCDSQKKEVCSCNVTSLDLSGISLSKEVHEEVAIWTQNNSAVGSCFQENRSKEKLDRDAKEPSAEAQMSVISLLLLQFLQSILFLFFFLEASALELFFNFFSLLVHDFRCCHGKGCRSTYHLYCLDPSLIDVPPGVWHCLHCVRKKIESGIHAVSEGVESICDVREVEVSNSKGMQKEKQYLVKYKGLAHVHNRWIPEKQLVDEAFVLVSKFELRHQKEKAVVKWKLEWTVPQRLLKKRLVMSPKQADDYFGGCGHNFSNYLYEWLVKWKGLGYEHATWELENEPFLSTDEAMALIRDYESRYEKSKKSSDPSRVVKVLQERNGLFHKLPTLPSGCSPGLDNDHLVCVNKLRECWHKCQNAVVIDDQERIMEVIFFIISLESYACRPFLIISSSTVLHVWEAELRRLAPSINVVTYSGNKDVRKCIQALEFYEEGGCAMVEVLLSSPDVVVEDLEALELLGWEAIIVDECQYSRVSQHFEQIKMLASDFRLLLCSGQLKDNIPEYINLLSFLDSESNGIDDDSSMIGPSDDIGILAGLKERLAQYIAYERKLDSKFIEYWVPVQLSDVQLEQYCATLLSNSCSLRSCAKTDHVGALRDILSLTRKCCDHPYLVDLSLQMKLTKGHPEVEYLDVGINASGKLQLLDKLLPEIKKRGLRTLILFQSTGRSRQYSIGDILDDYLRQRFGTYSYERVDSGLSNSKKQAALNIFNDKARGRFAFLIENRACLSSIKLSAVDTIIIFDSDWNPLNDLRYLQKICIDSQCEHLKVFRLYSSCTVEEKSLILAKQGMTIESTRENINRSTSHMLLIWGASYLFNELDKFHGCSSPNADSNASDQSLLNDVVSELLTELPHTAEESGISNPVILKVKHSGVTYPRSISLLGETVMQSRDEESPHVFWRKLLEGRYPSWRYISMPSPRARKKVQYFDELPKKPEAVNDEVTKKRKKAVDIMTDPIYLGTWLERKRRAISSDRKTKMINISKLGQSPNGSSFASPKKASISSGMVNERVGSSGTQAENGVSLSNINDLNDSSTMPPMAQDISKVPHVNKVGAEGRKKLRDARKSLYILLKPEISKLCETLQLPEDAKHIAGKFLEYVMNRYHVSTEPGTIFQAFQISLCWTAAALSKYKVNHRESLELAKEHLHFQCKEDEAESVYSKLQMLMKRFSHQMSASKNATAMTSLKVKSNASRNEDILRRSSNGKTSESISSDSQELEEGERRESPQRTSQECTSDSLRNGHILRQLLDERTFESAASDQQEVEDGEIRESSQIHSWPGRGPVEREQAPNSAKANENDGANMHPSSSP
ncbi:uncharacterized protein LOC131247018, partial [Magnolia sinica]|uniref:uncharacterized protein LOC131247018 n=1 Tax=Magnolia sinica TaxID=86752 RepID=UPI00265AA481